MPFRELAVLFVCVTDSAARSSCRWRLRMAGPLRATAACANPKCSTVLNVNWRPNRTDGGGVGQQLEVVAEDGWTTAVQLSACHLVNDRDDILDDLVKSDYLHEAG